MSSSSTSSRKPKLFKVDLDGNVYCHHDVVAVRRVAGLKSERHGEEFYGCSHWLVANCKFFLWKEDVDNMFKECSNGTSTPITFEELKIKNLELHNMLLLEENKKLKANRFDTETTPKKPYVLTLLIAIAIWLYMSK